MKTIRTRWGSVRSQTFVFFVACAATILLFCGLGMDGGLLYISQARLSRACDAAVLNAGRNLSLSYGTLATKIRDVAVANDVELNGCNTMTGPTAITNGTQYVFTGGAHNATITVQFLNVNGVFKATCTASLDVKTTFMAVSGIDAITFYRLSAIAEAQAPKPRLIILIVDRSFSMFDNGGAADMEVGITNFFHQFSTNVDRMGFYSYGNYARREFGITNNFWTLGTNKCAAPQAGSSAALQGLNPVNTNTMRFAGSSAPSEALRMAMEDVLAYPNQASYQKYVVFFSGSKMDSFRTLLYSPGYTNSITIPNSGAITLDTGTAWNIPFTNMPGLITNSTFTTATNSSGAYYTNLYIYMQPGTRATYTFSSGKGQGDGTTAYNCSRSGASSPITYRWDPTILDNLTGGINNVPDDNQYLTIQMKRGDSLVFYSPGYTNLDAVICGYTRSTSSKSLISEYMASENDWRASYPGSSLKGKTGKSFQTNSYQNDTLTRTNIMSDFIINRGQDVSVPAGSTQDVTTYAANAFFFTRSHIVPQTPNLNQYPTIAWYDGSTQSACWISTNMNRITGTISPQAYLFLTNGATISTYWTGYTNLAATTYTNFSYGRPAKFYSFSQNQWVTLTNWVDGNLQLAPEARWLSSNYVYRCREDLGAKVYSITLRNSSSQPDFTTVQAMANQSTDPWYNASQQEGKYYDVINSKKLVEAFQEIANKINELTLTK